MKTAILSMQRVVNFGSVLQAYSLREMVRELTGCDADFLDIEESPALSSAKSVCERADYAQPAAYSMNILQRGKRWTISRLSAYNRKKIRAFMRDELKLTDANSAKQYDHVIVGSDEVFNHAGGNIRLQLHGGVKQAAHLFTYAASCGNALFEDIAAEDLPRLRAAMQRYSAMSVRDSATETYVSQLYDGKIQRHLDPVLTGNLYRRKPKKVPLKNYLLVYAYGQRIRTAEEINAIRSFAGEKGLKIVAVGGSQFWCDLYLPLSPFRLLDYFHSADYVVTDTFHGSIFSVINHKKFAVIFRKSNTGKLESLLRDLGLEERRIDDLSRLSDVLCSEIDYQAVDTILDRERIRAREYLREQLNMDNPKIELANNAADCCGCGACAAACPVGAISMAAAADGCKYPRIDGSKCIECGKCQKLCSDRSALSRNMPVQAYAAVGRDEALVQNSASGGVFAALAKSHLASGGMAAGAVMTFAEDGLQVFHVLSDREEDLRAMQGSKYVQSDARRCYEAVLAALKDGKKVLFSGTPCQAAAVKQLSGDPENLLTMDLVCHGVPPLKMLRDYAQILEKRFGGKLTGLNFRDKRCKKSFYSRLDMRCRGKNKHFFLSSSLQSFYKYFLSGAIYRESCYACPYACLNRVSDLTIGDYWGIEKKHASDFESGKIEKRSDWSCILVNTPKGRDFLQLHKDALQLFETEAQWIAEGNQQLNHPSVKPENRERILKLYQAGGYRAVEADFIRNYGGRLRYAWRMIKNLRANQTKENKG